MRRVTPLRSDPEKVREFNQRARTNSNPKRRAISPASTAQRDKVRGTPCVACGEDRLVHPAHLIDRSLCPEGADDPRAVIPACPTCHHLYDTGKLSLLEYLEPRFRVELAFAVERFGLISTLERVTNDRWSPA